MKDLFYIKYITILNGKEKNMGIKFCIMSLQHTGNKIHNECKQSLQLHFEKMPLCFLGGLGPRGWELVRWCCPVNIYIQVNSQRRLPLTVSVQADDAADMFERLTVQSRSTTACVVQAESPHRVLVQRPQTLEPRSRCCTVLWALTWFFHVSGYGDSGKHFTGEHGYEQSSGRRQVMRLLGLFFTTLGSNIMLNWFTCARGANSSDNYFCSNHMSIRHLLTTRRNCKHVMSVTHKGSTCKSLSPSLSFN